RASWQLRCPWPRHVTSRLRTLGTQNPMIEISSVHPRSFVQLLQLTRDPPVACDPPVVGWGAFKNFQVIEIEKAPQVGLEPTTLRLTAGSNNYCLVLPGFASSCFLVLLHRKQTDLLLASICRFLL